MAITANTCYNSHTSIYLDVSYSSVPIGILSEVHPTAHLQECDRAIQLYEPKYRTDIFLIGKQITTSHIFLLHNYIFLYPSHN